MHPLPPPTEPLPWPLKLATLLFSGSVATMAIARAGLAGCGAPPAQVPAKAPPMAPPAARAPALVADPMPPAPAPTPPPPSLDRGEDVLPDRYFGGAKSDDEVWVPARAKPAQPAQQPERGQR